MGKKLDVSKISDGRKRSLANLRPANKENAAARGRLGGIASGESKRKGQTMREILLAMLDMPSKKRKGMTNAEAVCAELLTSALKGNLKACELLRDTIGQKPSERERNTIAGNVIVSWINSPEAVDDKLQRALEVSKAVALPVSDSDSSTEGVL